MFRLFSLPLTDTAKRRAQREAHARITLNAAGGRALIYTDGSAPRGGREIPEREYHKLPIQDYLWLRDCQRSHAQETDAPDRASAALEAALEALEAALEAERARMGGAGEDKA